MALQLLLRVGCRVPSLLFALAFLLGLYPPLSWRTLLMRQLPLLFLVSQTFLFPLSSLPPLTGVGGKLLSLLQPRPPCRTRRARRWRRPVCRLQSRRPSSCPPCRGCHWRWPGLGQESAGLAYLPGGDGLTWWGCPLFGVSSLPPGGKLLLPLLPLLLHVAPAPSSLSPTSRPPLRLASVVLRASLMLLGSLSPLSSLAALGG